MESLALAVAIILAVSVLGGPLSLLLSLPRPANRTLEVILRVAVVVLGSLAVLLGLRTAMTDIAMAGKVMTLLGAACGGWALFRVFRRMRSPSS